MTANSRGIYTWDVIRVKDHRELAGEELTKVEGRLLTELRPITGEDAWAQASGR